ncbi:uncharacterized protein LOC142814665 [Rhipicephalus microplus]|uniref:uncharacterized protein LOC142814665 n=1 Tax=Rhipicephalus microplus TaxID=6941 RepID=UPI003F6C45ED
MLLAIYEDDLSEPPHRGDGTAGDRTTTSPAGEVPAAAPAQDTLETDTIEDSDADQDAQGGNAAHDAQGPLRAPERQRYRQSAVSTGTQAMLKFKNITDRRMKLVSEVEANTRSGAPGNHCKIKWPLFAIIDSMLRQTPHYAEKPVTNMPQTSEDCSQDVPQTAQSILNGIEICLEEECPEGSSQATTINNCSAVPPTTPSMPTGKPTDFTPSRSAQKQSRAEKTTLPNGW